MSPAYNTVDEYLAHVPQDMRPALEHLRATIKAVAPQAEEGLSYSVPAFKYRGVLVSFGAAKDHCSFYVQSPAVMEAHADDLKGYDTAKGTIRFKPNEPLPSDLVTVLVKARMAENEATRKK
jgi:uncharacterized protein YdhG (YjbR/CyaY superfamily)